MTLGITISLIVATLLTFILILALYARHFSDRDVKILMDIAKKYGGKISVDSFNTSATMDFQHRGAIIKFYQQKALSGKAARCCLRCEIDYSTPLSMHIGRGISVNTSVDEIRHLMCMPKVDIGSERFKREFTVRGNNKSFINALLASDFERRLLTITSNDPVLYMYPMTSAGKSAKGKELDHFLEFSISQTPRKREELEKIIEDGLGVVRKFLGSNTAR